ncbi:hypothetical protein halTADL_0790 [Halohasta litchfieldiae]|jgi:hypothetical protein|uniref:DUF8159 domain-containing protein n=1 Tax=Halohasta litchfieldiae TaxID=1073996 RepID=A0A1H6V9X1_9EURY|nr:hypothetical protein [Halohasta litchfieldiae]ATW87588.1 hypothetical protein halTADL_0790 [Halohasta litchfieldiae]SEI97460.1 hypothetical protein SAMN05444271_11446 [Halohasta litchfieldiae]
MSHKIRSKKDDAEHTTLRWHETVQGLRILAIGSFVILCILSVAVNGVTASTPTDQLPLTQQTDDELSEEQILVLFETVIEDQGIELQTVEIDEEENILSVEYYSTGTTEQQVVEDMGTITGVYAGAIDQGVTTDRMEVTALDPVDDSETASWYAETEWAESYNAGEMTADEFSMRVLLTLEEVEN